MDIIGNCGCGRGISVPRWNPDSLASVRIAHRSAWIVWIFFGLAIAIDVLSKSEVSFGAVGVRGSS